MKTLSVICEGHSENEFVDFILRPFFNSKGFQCYAFKITQSDGGLSNYSQYKNDILKCVFDENTIVTSLIDFYALPSNFPGFAESKGIRDKTDRVKYLENAIEEDIKTSQRKQFNNLLPYIQLHEFEAFTFSDIVGFDALFENTQADFISLNKIIADFPNPEDINNSPLTAPSKRLLNHIPRYNKIVDGNLIILEIGLDKVRLKCPRFNNWIESLLIKLSE